MANTVQAYPVPYEPAASRLESLDGLISGLPRGAITEVLGPTSSGRTSLMQALLATGTQGGEVCAVIDADSAFDPQSAKRSGADLGKILWIDCHHRFDLALRATDMVLHAGGFGLVFLDLGDVLPEALQRVPTSHWYRFQRTVEHTATALVVLSRQSNTRSCAARQIEMTKRQPHWLGCSQFALLERVDFQAGSRKPFSSTQIPLEAVAGS